MDISIKTKYYRIKGHDGFNRNNGCFYGVIKLLGKFHGASNKKSFGRGLKELKARIKRKISPISSSEVHNLINSRIQYTYIEANKYTKRQVYRISKKADLILKELFSMLEEIEASKNYQLKNICSCPSGFYYNWRNHIISDCDDKFWLLANCPIKKHKKKLKQLYNNILELNQPHK